MNNRLFCGAGKADFTATMDMLPVTVFTPGNNRPIVGIIDHTYVRVIILSDGENKSVIVSYDMPAAPDSDGPNSDVTPAIAMIAKHLGIPEENVMAFGTHAHSVPGVGCLKPTASEEEKNFNEVYSQRVYAATMEAVKQAQASMKPAKVGVAKGKSYINVNRNQTYSGDTRAQEVVSLGANPEGPSDKTLFTLRFEDMEGKPIAFYVNYAVHGVVMMCNTVFEDGVGISADLPGAASTMLEEHYEGAVAVWSPGPAGDQNPTFMSNIYYPDPATGKVAEKISKDSKAVLLPLATRHFDDILRTLAKIDEYSEKIQIACAVDWSSTPGRLIIKEDPKDFRSPIKEIVTEGAPDYKVRMQLMRIGDIAIIGTSGELYSSLGQHVREVSPLKNTCVATICGTRNPGYIFDDEAFARGGHGAQGAKMLPGYLYDNLANVARGLFDKIKK